MDIDRIRALLEHEAAMRNRAGELCEAKPDPLHVASRYKNETVALLCALFGYGNAALIVRFLESLDFGLLDADEAQIRRTLATHYYRFQKTEDVQAIFIALRRLKREASLRSIFLSGYSREANVLHGINALIDAIYDIYPYHSRGYTFLVGTPWKGRNGSPYKRWNMFLRWMVRKDALDMGLWKGISRSDLLIPLDTHTFNVSRTLGLLQRKQYDLRAVFELTAQLRLFDPEDPVRFDFALYRLGQEHLLAAIK